MASLIKKICWGAFLAYLTASINCFSQTTFNTVNSANNLQGEEKELSEGNFSVHGQITYMDQHMNNFKSPYYGDNSLMNSSQGNADNSYTLSTTLFLGARLWPGAEVFYDPELFQGTPFGGQLTGLGSPTNGELQKGMYIPFTKYNARLFIKQTFGLGGDTEYSETGLNQIAGSLDRNRLVFTFGKFATLDYFDQNTYSHDPRVQFGNFALFSMGAYGYSADTKGYTYGVVGEWFQDDWILRIARLAMPTIPNLNQLDFTLVSDYTNQVEVTKKYQLRGQPGAIRALLYQQHATMASYQDALNLVEGTGNAPNIYDVRYGKQDTWGYGLNWEQAITKDIGVFARWSWNPGQTETQTLDISNSLSFGASMKGALWKRPADTVGLGIAQNGISALEINYLQSGGMTMFIGDGALNYRKEQIVEAYYSAKIMNQLFVTLDYQYIANPAYNADRGPVNFVGIRGHFEF